jgi:hypothetical protein
VLHPVGPLPARVYWLRRAYVAAAVLVVLVLLWVVAPNGGGGARPDTAAAVSSATAESGAPTSLAATPPADDPGRAEDADPTSPGTSAASSTAPVVTARPKPAPPPVCPDRALSLQVRPEHPEFRVGSSPRILLDIRNVSSLSCLRDVGSGQQELVLMRGTARLWSSNDCYPEDVRDVRLLRPGAALTFGVVWSGLSSRPKCAGTRTRVGAGTYQLVARLGTLVSRPAPLVLR